MVVFKMDPSSPDQLPKADPNVISPFTGQPYPAQSLDERITSFRRWMIRRYPRHFAQTFRTFDLDYEAYLREPSPPKSNGIPSNLTTPTEVENAVLTPKKEIKAELMEADDKSGVKKDNRRKRPNSPYAGGWKSRSPSPSSSGRRNRRNRQSDRRRRDSPDRKRYCASPSPDAITTTPPAGAIEHPSMGDLERLTIQVSNYPTSMSLSQLASILGECGPIRDIKQVRTQGLRLNTAYVQFWLPESVEKVGTVATAHRLNVLLPNLAVSSSETPKDTPKNESAFEDDSDEHSPLPENATECLFLSDFYTAVNRTDSREDYAILARESLLFSVQQSLKDNHGIEHIYPFRQPSLFGRIAVKCATIAEAFDLHKYLTNLGHKVTFVPLAEYMKVFLDAVMKPSLQVVSDNYQAFRDGTMSRKKFFELEEASRQKRHDQFLDFLTEIQVCEELAGTGSKEIKLEPSSSVMTPIQKGGGFNFGIKINLGFNASVDVKPSVSVAERVEESMDVVTSDESQKTTPEMVKREIKDDDWFGLEKLFEGDDVAEEPEDDRPIKEEVIDETEEPMENGSTNPSETATDAPIEIEVRKLIDVMLRQVENLVDAPAEAVIIKDFTPKVIKTEPPIKPASPETIEDLLASLKPTKTALSNTPSCSTPYGTPKKTPKPSDKITRSLIRSLPMIPNYEADDVLDKLTELEKLIKTKPGTRKPSKPTVKTMHMFRWKSAAVQETVKKAMNKDELFMPFKHISDKEDAQLLIADKNYAAEEAKMLASDRGR